jgi:hypothetical protein
MSNELSTESLRRALEQLPAFEPPAGGWAAIEARLAPATARRRYRAGAAAAAALAGLAAVALALWPGLESPRDAAREAPALNAATAGAELVQRSAQLERLLAALPPARGTRASTGLTSTLLEDRIAMVDERLSLAPGDDLPPAATRALWRERVLLLDSLVRVRYAAAVDPAL